MSRQPVTVELRRWIVEQSAAGHSPESIVAAMQASGWQPGVARTALETTLRERDPGAPLEAAGVGAGAEGDDAGLDADPSDDLPRSPVPGAHLEAGRPTVQAAGRSVRILTAMRAPRVVVFANLLSESECSELIALARTRLARSETVETRSGSSEINAARTSDGMFFEPAEYPVCARLEERLADLLQWPLENGEGLQILRYRPGAEYKPHYDYFDPGEPGTPSILARGGQRVASIVCYLNTPEQGGATVFPDAGLEVAPLRGNAVFFSYDRPHPATRSLHGGAPVLAGEKWVATKWMRERRFE